MLRIVKHIIIIMISFQVCLLAQDKISDNLKFKNGVHFIKLGRIEKAKEVFLEYLELFPQGIHRHEAYEQLAEIYFKKFDLQKAIKMYKYLYEEFNNSEDGVRAYFKIGLCYKKMGYNKKAIEIFKTIISEHSQSAYSHQAKMQIDLIDILQE